MRITVIGTGGIGGPYGASLAGAGADETFVARGAHRAAHTQERLRFKVIAGLRALPASA